MTKYNGLTDVAVLEHAIREDLNKHAQRRLAVLRPIKVILTNYPEGKVEQVDAMSCRFSSSRLEAYRKREAPGRNSLSS